MCFTKVRPSSAKEIVQSSKLPSGFLTFMRNDVDVNLTNFARRSVGAEREKILNVIHNVNLLIVCGRFHIFFVGLSVYVLVL